MSEQDEINTMPVSPKFDLEPEKPKQDQKKKWIIIIAIVLILLCCCLVLTGSLIYLAIANEWISLSAIPNFGVPFI